MAVENFLTYPEVDPNSRITVTSSRVTWASLDRNETAYVASDKGTDFFDGDFVHLLTASMTSNSGSSTVYGWALTNTLDSLYAIDAASGDYLGLNYYGYSATRQLVLAECDGGAVYASNAYSITLTTVYYVKIVRDEAVGTYGTLYCYIYSDSARTTLLATLTLTLHTSKKDFRYVHAVNSWDSSETPHIQSGYTEHLTIEGGGASVLPEVTQQALTNVAATTATGNGNITSLGNSAVTAHGHCWNTTGTPTTGDSNVDNGAGSLGAFTSAITGLTPGVTYYVRAYATNSYGTSYSTALSFIAGSTTSTMVGGNIAVIDDNLHWIGRKSGLEKFIVGNDVS